MLFASSSCLPDNYWAGSFTSVLNTALNTLTEIYLYNQFIDTTVDVRSAVRGRGDEPASGAALPRAPLSVRSSRRTRAVAAIARGTHITFITIRAPLSVCRRRG
jgi:hypothetical protein